MSSETTALIAYLGAGVGIVGGAIALFNARKAVLWKRAELASSYLKELSSNDELVFACRALDWNGGKLVVPEKLRPLLDREVKWIVHERTVLQKAMEPELSIAEMQSDDRLQLYRTALDSLLSWLALISNALERRLFRPEDIQHAAYWVFRIEYLQLLDGFIDLFGYRRSIKVLRTSFEPWKETYNGGAASSIERGGFGQSASGSSASE
ncbi:MAG: hypothetical protein QOH65_1604 [Methylobacteriaceae bacterium]|jgi:hypothetical protein|nr:hypothetical protein [Methylobacteriaceae bacterium]